MHPWPFAAVGERVGEQRGSLLHGEVPNTTQEKGQSTKYKSGFVCAPLAAKPFRHIQKNKKKKQKPGEILRRGEERSTHHKSRLRLVLVLLE